MCGIVGTPTTRSTLSSPDPATHLRYTSAPAPKRILEPNGFVKPSACR